MKLKTGRTCSGILRGVATAALFALLLCVWAEVAQAQTEETKGSEGSLQAAVSGDLNFNLNLDTSTAANGGKLSDLMKIVVVLSVLTLVPALLLTMTAFTRIVIVLSFVRRALTVQQIPPNQILIGLSLFLTFFVMGPVLAKINATALQPNLRGEISEIEALQRAEIPLREFMMRQTRKTDLRLFVRLTRMERPTTPEEVPTHVLVPAFAMSEIRTAFQMGFIVFLPMLAVDIVVATLLISMGMFMLPPPMVSVPLKILVFVLVDGWQLVIGSLAQSFI